MPTLMTFDGEESWPRKIAWSGVEDTLLDATWVDGVATTIATTTTLTLSATSINNGGSVTLTATVSGTPTGSVVFERLVGSTWTPISTDTGSPWTATHSPTADTSYRARYLGNGTYLTSTSSTKTLDVKQQTTYTKTYLCGGSQTYQGDGDKRTDVGNKCYQGYYSPTNGYQHSVVIFPYANIQSDLSGATITKVEVYLYAEHWGPDSGGTAIIGDHNYASVPASNPTGNDDVSRVAWSSKTGGKWCNVSTNIGNRLRDNTAKGILLGWHSTTGASSANEYYGYFSGNNATNEPQLRITYWKWV